MTSLTTKRCSRCGQIKPTSEFGGHTTTKDRLRPECNECRRERQRTYSKTPKGREIGRQARTRYKRSSKGKQAQTRYRRTERAKETARQARTRRHTKHPEKRSARNAVTIEIRAGRLPPARDNDCKDCGKVAQVYHHESYAEEDWLSVIPLCKRCHNTRHKRE